MSRCLASAWSWRAQPTKQADWALLVGRFDSSKTTVSPVFTALLARDPTGRTWLPQLLGLGSRAPRIEGLANDPGLLPAGHPRWWGRNERQLEPPRDLLRWLVRNAAEPDDARALGRATARNKRQRLVGRDPATVQEALHLLDGSLPRRAWYVLEGRSQPDACLETDRVLVVFEGKRTERKATTTTTWMPKRSQMVRHMDAAWEVRGQRRVLGLMIVEGVDPDGAPAAHWLRDAEAQFSEDMLTSSLPHRRPEERAAIAAGFLGLTTWQRVCHEFRLPWPPDD